MWFKENIFYNNHIEIDHETIYSNRVSLLPK